MSGIGFVFPEVILSTTAHGIDHNHSLPHIKCSDEYNDYGEKPTSHDDNYPYNASPPGNGSENTTGNRDDFGRISKMGYDFRNENYVSKTPYHDIISYCVRTWISDYHYNKIYNLQTALNTAINPNIKSLITSESDIIIQSFQQSKIVPLTYFSGVLENNNNIRILSTLELEERFNTPSSGTLEYVAETSSGAVYRGFFTPVQIDHSPDQYF